MKKQAVSVLREDEQANSVILKWSDILESAFDYYYTEYMPAWTLNATHLNNAGDKIFISKKDSKWVSWENIEESERPHVATIFDLLPDLPEDEVYWAMMREMEEQAIKEPEDHFWENIFSYKPVNEVESRGKKYRIDWEA